MAQEISQLDPVVTPLGTDMIPTTQAADAGITSKKLTLQQVTDYTFSYGETINVSFMNVTGDANSITNDSAFIAKNSAATIASYGFNLKNSANNFVPFGKIQCQATATTAGSESSKLTFYTYTGGIEDVAFYIDTINGSKLTGALEVSGNLESSTFTAGASTFTDTVTFTDATPQPNFTPTVYINNGTDALSINHEYKMPDSNGVLRMFGEISCQALSKTAGAIQGTLGMFAYGALFQGFTIGTGTFNLNNIPISFNGSVINGINTLINATLMRPITESGSSLTLDNTHNYKMIYCTSSGAVTVTIPTGLSSTFCCGVVQFGTGQLTIVGAGGVTLKNSANAFRALSQNSRININQSPTANTYLIDGEVKV